VPIDIPEAVPTTRRTFLTRAALAGALVTVGSAAGPLTSLLPAAGAQDGTDAVIPELDDAAFATFALPLELAAVQAYQDALSGEVLGPDWTQAARTFQVHHQAVVDTLTTLLPTTTPPAPDPKPDVTIQSSTGAAVKAATDEKGVLGPLFEMEGILAATHLYALGGLVDSTTAKTVAQVCAVESQHATALGRAMDADQAEITPDEARFSAARTPGATGSSSTTTTSTTTTEEGGN